MAKGDEDVDEVIVPEDRLPDEDAAKEFYAKYEPKEILGRLVLRVVALCRRCLSFWRCCAFQGCQLDGETVHREGDGKGVRSENNRSEQRE